MTTETSGQRALNLVDARNYLGGISHQTIYRLMGSGSIKSYKIGTRRFILVSDLDRYIEGQVGMEL